MDLPDWTYLKGYFISEQYFLDHEDTIRRELAFKEPPDAVNSAAIARMQKSVSVSVHVRRGDVLDSTNHYLLMSHDYYLRAADRMAAELKTDPTFFIFSDDHSWVVENFQLPFPMEVVTNNDGALPAEDMRLMSSCQHHITANSTFSWWGAWLNPSRDKTVVAPKVWYRNPDIDISTVFPKQWIRL